MISDKVVTLELFADDFERYEEFCKAHDLSLYNGLPYLLDSLNVPSADEIRAERRGAALKLSDMPGGLGLLWENAEAGDAFAQAELAVRYYSGRGVEQDYAQAFFWAERAAAEGVGSAELLLGVMYLAGEGVEQDYAKAYEIFCRLAECGDLLYQTCAGICSIRLGAEGERGKPNPENVHYQAAVSWFSKAAEQRDAAGEMMLGLCYVHGFGVEIDEERGRVLLSRARIRGEEMPAAVQQFLDGVLSE